MAVSFSKASQTKFFSDVFGAGYVLANIDPLINAGVVLQSGFSDISATLDGLQHKLNLMVGLTQLIKTKNNPTIAHVKTREQIQKFIAELNKMVVTHTWKTHTPMAYTSQGGYKKPMPEDIAAEFQNQVAKASGIPGHMLKGNDPTSGYGGFAKAYPQDAMGGFGTGGAGGTPGAIGKAGSGGFAGGGAGGGGGGVVGSVSGGVGGGMGGSGVGSWPVGGHAHTMNDPGHSHTIHGGSGLSPKKVEAIKKGLAAQVAENVGPKAKGFAEPSVTQIPGKLDKFQYVVHDVPCVKGKAFTQSEAQDILAAWKSGYAFDYLPPNPETIYNVTAQLSDDDYDTKFIQHPSVSGEPVVEQQKVPNPEKLDAKIKMAEWHKLVALVQWEAFHLKQDAIKKVVEEKKKFEADLAVLEGLKHAAIPKPVEDWTDGSVDAETEVFVDSKGNLKKSVKPKPPVSGVVKLRDATTIGQAVRGTSSDSVYRVIATNKVVKLAARLHSGSKISLRAEFVTPNSLSNNVTSASLKAMGMSPKDNGSYYSVHMDCENVPPARVVGAVLFGFGIDFDAQIKSLKEIQ